MSEDLEEFRESEGVEELRRTVDRLGRDLAKEKHRSREVVEAVYRAARDATSGLQIKPVKKPATSRRKGAEETAVIVLSDLQLGMVTDTYNSEVAEERVERYCDKVIDITDMQRTNHPVRRAKLYLLGDLVEGEEIYPSQAHQLDSSLFRQTCEDGPRILTSLIRRLLSHFEHLDVVSVPGNHGDMGGASRKRYNPETNADRILSRIVQHIIESSGQQRVTFNVPSGFGKSGFYAVDYVGETGFMLWHGHQVRRYSNASHRGFYDRVMGWRAGAIKEPFHVSLCGHHHTPTMLYMNDIVQFINGSFEDENEYARESLAATSRAAQWLLYARPDRGLTSQYLVYLDD